MAAPLFQQSWLPYASALSLPKASADPPSGFFLILLHLLEPRCCFCSGCKRHMSIIFDLSSYSGTEQTTQTMTSKSMYFQESTILSHCIMGLPLSQELSCEVGEIQEGEEGS